MSETIEKQVDNSIQFSEPSNQGSTTLTLSEENSNDLEIIRTISKSRFIIFLCYSKSNNSYYAMKVYPYKKNRINPSFLNELRFSFHSHPNILTISEGRSYKIGSYQGSSFALSYLLLEYAPYGDITLHIKNHTLPKDDDRLTRTYFHNIIDGIEYLHSKGIAHMDLKLDNLLICQNFTLKLADFDFSNTGINDYVCGKGTPNFRAPELKLNNCSNRESVDVYAAAICLFGLKSHNLPYREDRLIAGVNLWTLLLDEPKRFWKIWEKLGFKFELSFKVLFESMTRRLPNKRIDVKLIKESTWYKGPIYSQKEVVKLLHNKIKPLYSDVGVFSLEA